MPTGNEELKYEGLIALMIGMEERIDKKADQRMVDFREFVDHRFTKVDDHNAWQNGSMHKMAERVHKLEHKTDEIGRGNNYVRLLKWIDTHPRKSIVLIIGTWSAASLLVTNAVCNHWMPRLWDLILNVVK